MLPIILGVAGLAAIYKFKPNCSVCNSKLTWNQHCLFDGKPVCSTCGESVKPVEHQGIVISSGGRCCRNHMEGYAARLVQEKADIDQQIADAEMMRIARAKSAQVKTWPKTYKGEVPAPKLGKLISTEKINDKEEALAQLKTLAVLDGCFHVQQVELHRSGGEEGNYKFSVWHATGII